MIMFALVEHDLSWQADPAGAFEARRHHAISLFYFAVWLIADG